MRFTPYTEQDRAATWDDYALGGMLVFLGGLRMLLALALHERFGTEATLAVIAVIVGVLVLVSAALRRLTAS